MKVAMKLYEDFKQLTPERMSNTTEDNVIIASLLHDICKVNTYSLTFKNVKVDGEWTQVKTYKKPLRFTLI